mmetsp:Transcript_64162/g.119288  ORF Transcript_64162/g.119288 Transcript_64162/m.119288 type:complete len:206 (-) Transcript_64162:87-704(-)
MQACTGHRLQSHPPASPLIPLLPQARRVVAVRLSSRPRQRQQRPAWRQQGPNCVPPHLRKLTPTRQMPQRSRPSSSQRTQSRLQLTASWRELSAGKPHRLFAPLLPHHVLERAAERLESQHRWRQTMSQGPAQGVLLQCPAISYPHYSSPGWQSLSRCRSQLLRRHRQERQPLRPWWVYQLRRRSLAPAAPAGTVPQQRATPQLL